MERLLAPEAGMALEEFDGHATPAMGCSTMTQTPVGHSSANSRRPHGLSVTAAPFGWRRCGARAARMALSDDLKRYLEELAELESLRIEGEVETGKLNAIREKEKRRVATMLERLGASRYRHAHM